MYCTAAVTAFKSTCYTLVCMKELRMSNNAQLMSTAPSVFVRDTCPPSVWQKFGTKTEHHSLRQVTAPSFLHVTPKY